MAIDLRTEDVFPLAEAPNRLPKKAGGKKINLATVYRWAKDGREGVHLETLRLGSTTLTSMEAIQRFAERLTEGHDGAASPARTTGARRRAVAAADRELDRLGV